MAEPDLPAPWERQKGESAKAYAAFRAYRDAGATRSLTKAAQELNKARCTLADWSRRWHWVARAEAHDREQDRRHREWMTRARADADRSSLQLARSYKSQLAGRLQALNPAELSTRDMAYWLDVVNRVERSVLVPADEGTAAGDPGRAMIVGLIDEVARRADG